jgi:L-histidine N-alpha-methyltransferase
MPAEPTTARRRCVIDRHLDGSAWSSLAEDVLDGLTRPFKELPPKYFYDDRGAELFERITALPEYYPTRAERSILEASSSEIAELTAAAELVELGSGSAVKTRLLLGALHEAGTLRRYVPVDVTESAVRSSARALMREFPELGVHGVIGDFEHHLDQLPKAVGPRLVAFLGGTIGNFIPGSRRRFLRSVGQLLDGGGYLLLGTDLVKDHDVLRSAYDDSEGVTADFNRNVLRVINRELDGDFDPEAFDHVALFDTRNEWIEMRLRAREPHTVTIGKLELTVHFAAGEEIRTEISAKFTRRRVQRDLAAAGLELSEWLTDPDEQFALSLARRLEP